MGDPERPPAEAAFLDHIDHIADIELANTLSAAFAAAAGLFVADHSPEAAKLMRLLARLILERAQPERPTLRAL